MTGISLEPGAIVAPNGQLARQLAVENNWYEGSRWSPNRSFVWFPVQDAKHDLDRFTRYELSKHARYLWKNSCLIRGVIERIVTLTIGSGFHPVFKSSNPKWNLRAKQWWAKKQRNISLGAKSSACQYQRSVQRAKSIDGECFSIKTFNNTLYCNQIQGIESERVTGHFASKAGNEANTEFDFSSGGLVDGFNLDKQGCVVSYNLRGIDKPYPAECVVHHMTPNRLGQYRGETILASAINTARDIDDILALEKECVKDASSKKDIIKTATGQLDAEQFRNLRYGSASVSGQYPTTFNLPADDNTKDDYYRIRFGASPVVLKRGDEYTPYTPTRPGAAWQGFMDFLSQTICLSTSIPPSVIIPIKVGGTDIRRDLETAQRAIDPWQMDIAAEMDELLNYLMQEETIDGCLRQDLPDDYDNIAWNFPMKIYVDRGQAQQDREDVARGLMSLEEYHGRYGMDSLEVEKTIIQEAVRRKEAIAQAGFESTKEFVQVLSLDPTMFQGQEFQEEKEQVK